jgi:uncharacterized protein
MFDDHRARADSRDAVRSPQRSRLRDVGRWAQLLAGLLAYGVAIALLIRSGLGLGPWDAFHVGLSEWSGWSVGAVIVAVGVVIIGFTLFIGIRPGPATLLNMILIGVFVDLLLPLVPAAPRGFGLPYHLTGIGLTGLATGLYIAPGLGEGPRDGMMIGVAQRTGWRVGRVRTGIEVSVLLIGWTLGGRIGFGTLLFAFAIGPATEWGLRLFAAESPTRRRRSEGVPGVAAPALPLPADPAVAVAGPAGEVALNSADEAALHSAVAAVLPRPGEAAGPPGHGEGPVPAATGESVTGRAAARCCSS